MTRRAAFGLAALSLGAFAFVTTETLPIGLLPQIAGSLRVSLPIAGSLVTLYAFIVALTAAPGTALTARVPRGALLMCLLSLLVATNVAAAFAPSYAALFVVRLVNAAGHGVFWSIVSVCAVRLVPAEARGTALSAIFGGVSLATVLGVPATTFAGQHFGWRVAFLCVAAAGTIVLVVIALVVRDPTPSTGSSLASIRALLAGGPFRSLLATTGLVVLGQFVAYTYIVPYVEDVVGFPPSATAPLLLLFGLAGVAGNIAAGALANRNPVAASLVMTSAIALALGGLAVSGDHRIAATAFLALWGFGAGGLAVGLQTRVLVLAPHAEDLGSSLFASAFNIGIGGGALLGALTVGRFGLTLAVPIGAGLASVALIVQAVSAASRGATARSGEAGSP